MPIHTLQCTIPYIKPHTRILKESYRNLIETKEVTTNVCESYCRNPNFNRVKGYIIGYERWFYCKGLPKISPPCCCTHRVLCCHFRVHSPSQHQFIYRWLDFHTVLAVVKVIPVMHVPWSSEVPSPWSKEFYVEARWNHFSFLEIKWWTRRYVNN